MKRKLVVGLAALGAASMLCGFDSAETADTLLQKMEESTASLGSVSMDMDLNCDATIEIGDGTTTSSLAILVTSDLNVAETVDPLAMKLEGTVDISALTEAETVDLQVYIVPNEDGTLGAYTYIQDSATEEEGTWTYSADDSLDLSTLTTQMESADVNLADWGISFELASEAADVDGVECYQLTSLIDSSTMTAVLSKAAEMTGEDLSADEDVSTLLAMLDGLVIRLDYYIDTTTYQPVKLHMDLNDSDFSILSSYVAALLGSSDSESTTTIDLVVNDVSVDVLCSYDTVDEITVPEEAIAAIAEQETAIEEQETADTEVLVG